MQNLKAVAERRQENTAIGFSGAVQNGSIAREVAQVQAQMQIAKCFPRNEASAFDKIEAACSRETLANGAIYVYAKGGQEVKGPSIRLAEACARAWGNMKYGFEETGTDADGTTVRAYAFDMESNTLAERTFRVANKIKTRNGFKTLDDPREIYENAANQAARRIRACIWEIIPSDFVDFAVDVCEKTRESKVRITPEVLSKLVAAFSKFGVTKAMIEARIQRKLEAITTTQLLNLREIFTSINDGIGKVADFFKPEAVVNEEAKATAVEVEPKKDEEPAPAPAPVDGLEELEDDEPFGDEEIAF